ncbi:MAG: DNRLRE domain-containing protein [Ignavibacteria bacterium]|nr:DNRLRE domain-containing protein [Ignavibacteria bacterium]
MKKSITRLFYVAKLLLVTLLLLFTSCSDEPNSTGFNLLNPNDLIELNKLDSQTDSLFQISSLQKRIVNLGGGTRLLVGHYKNLEASTLIRFNFGLSDSIKNALLKDSLSIISAKLLLYPTYKFDTLGNSFQLNVYEIQTWWGSDSFTSDSLNSSHFRYSVENIESNFNDSDTLVTCNLNANKVLSWLKAAADTSLADHPGIYLKSDVSKTNFIRGFRALVQDLNLNVTTLQVIYSKGTTTDTLKFIPSADVYVVKEKYQNNFDSKFIYLQSSLNYVSKLYFDISKLPKNAIINSASLELNLSKDKSILGSPATYDSIFVLKLIDSSKPSYDSLNNFVVTHVSTGLYKTDITRYVQGWVNGESNQGMLLNIYDPNGGLELLAFDGSTSDNFVKRPKLKIYYSIKR